MLSKSIIETKEIAQDFITKLSLIRHQVSNKALVVGLFGDLGSGKTTFTQAIGEILGITEFMTSPTFVIMKSYSLKPNTLQLTHNNLNLKPNTLIHIDAYRLESGQELSVLGFEEIQKDPQNLILIEWPEKVAEVLPKDLLKINFKFISEDEREVEFNF